MAKAARHPPYFEMKKEAILTLTERKGSRSSQQAIAKLIEEKHKKVLPSKFKKSLSVQLNKFVKSERLGKVNNSFKLSPTDNPKNVTHKTKKKAAPNKKSAKKIAEKPMNRKKARK
ncbi:hypothetical protein FH972_005853 [Carpinus fangiana]|uniref:H15 domain-containing protein n=1 Tax=Carpinus fangiana TaxID=176857 RepID=A0A5N6QRI5_9ROSI|nr:hypothetical protein FH972_005853 [Carpinus fangiana]